MATMITIGGVTVDAEDPCALWPVLYNARLRMLAGESISEVQAGDTTAQRRIAYASWFSNVAAIDAEIARLKDLCAQSQGERKARFAIRAGFRRWP